MKIAQRKWTMSRIPSDLDKQLFVASVLDGCKDVPDGYQLNVKMITPKERKADFLSWFWGALPWPHHRIDSFQISRQPNIENIVLMFDWLEEVKEDTETAEEALDEAG